MSLRRILGYRWHDNMSIDLVLREAGLREVTCLVRERQLCLYRHLVRLLGGIPPVGFFPVKIGVGGPCLGGVHRLHVCMR